VIVLPRDLKNNKEDIPDKMNDHSADCIRCRLQHNTNRLSVQAALGRLIAASGRLPSPAGDTAVLDYGVGSPVPIHRKWIDRIGF
jgi:hypothetical protein